MLHVEVTRADGTRRHEIALVDVCVSTSARSAREPCGKPDTLRELYCTFAEPDAIGLSSILGGSCRPAAPRRTASPSSSADRTPPHTVLAPIAPGLLEPVGARHCERAATAVTRTSSGWHRGTVALDGERELEFGPGDRISVTLRPTVPV